MNAIPAPGRKFTAYFVVASCHSVSNHVMHTPGLFCRHLSFFSSGSLAVAAVVSICLSFESLGLSSGFRVIIAHSPVAPHRIEFTFRASRPLSLRTGLSSSVALHGRISPPQLLSTTGPIDFGLTGTFTPLRCRLHSRTRSRLWRWPMRYGWRVEG